MAQSYLFNLLKQEKSGIRFRW